ncbi:serine protease Do [Azospirillum lipoferum]|uniref:Probable periplasmic serine endoprotease DegP-like n=1 Tax=Azospirillum lipoferum TaxID=193 RepID=A0A5A9GC11_AZOLI|nr:MULTISPECIES: DegQ family serine endoprotease [Azospirillum]KAA0591937.1 DegQ family serine endoprotease [Azospirillum lipoferum]MCP1614738.1 serine protease Do [Azospirillum lipoferum]MDW5537426.1 DegQ family serine endoprotease [Azospirillum sp. NL1]
MPHASVPRSYPIFRRLPAAALCALLSGAMLLPVFPVGQAAAQDASAGSPPGASRTYSPPSFRDLARTQIDTVVNISSTQAPQASAGGGRLPEGMDIPPGSPLEEFFREFRNRQRGGQGDGSPESGPNGGPQGGGPQGLPSMALGSGFIIDPSGLVVTNNHVVSDAAEIAVTLHDGTKLPAKLVGSDAPTDLALLKVESNKPLTAAHWGDSETVEVGDWVVAIGNPFGLGGSVTAGILSARARDIQQGPYDEYLQTDAAINRGNSGGPLYDANGGVIGINTAIYSPTGGSVGIGFAIPSSLAKPIIDQLKEDGKVRRGWLGVQVQRVTPDIAESLGVEGTGGALVTSVSPDSPAASAGLRQGDVITAFNGDPLEQMRQLPRLVASAEIGRTVPMTLLRGGKQQSIQVTVGELRNEPQQLAMSGSSGAPRSAQPEESKSALGLKLAPLTPGLRETFSIGEDVDGLVVTEVDRDSPASQRGLDLGDVIVEAGQEPVATAADLESRIAKAKEQGRKTLLMLVSRGGDLRYVPLPLDGKKG